MENKLSNLGDFGFRQAMELVLRNWFWFVLSVTVSVAVAGYVYIKTPLVFSRSASIMLQDKSGGSNEATVFADLGLLSSSNSLVENEIYVLRSASLMRSVVEELELNVSYSTLGRFRMLDLYGDGCPIKVSNVSGGDNSHLNLSIIPIDDKKFTLITANGESSAVRNYGDTLHVNNHMIVVTPTPCNGEYRGRQVEVALTSVADAQKTLSARLTVSKAEKNASSVVLVSTTDFSPQRADDIINTLIINYNEASILDKNRIAQNTDRFIMERLSMLGAELDGVDTDIAQVKQQSNVNDFNAAANMYMQSGNQLRRDAAEVDNQISMANYIKEYLLDPANENALIPRVSGVQSLGVDTQIDTYNEMRLRLDKILESSGANNPLVVEGKSQMAAIRMNIIQGINNAVNSLKIKSQNIRNEENLANRRIASVPTREKDVTSIIRQQKIKEELYLYLLNKREENALNLAITIPEARVIDSASGQSLPISPKLKMYALVALVVGLAQPFGVLMLIIVLDVKVRGRRDIEASTTIPVLNELPRKRSGFRGLEIVVREGGHDTMSEAFQILRGNIDFSYRREQEGAMVIAVTSTLKGEGKTFIASNLALSFTFTGKRVLLIDLDLRKGTLSKNLSLDNKPGVTNYLLGKVNRLSDIVNRGILNDKLDFIGGGTRTSAVASILTSADFDKFIADLRPYYDYIIVDNPPAPLVADTQLINRAMDYTLYVMRSGVIDRRYLPELERAYVEGRYKNLAVVISDSKMRSRVYGYGAYGYGYSYGYGYEAKHK